MAQIKKNYTESEILRLQAANQEALANADLNTIEKIQNLTGTYLNYLNSEEGLNMRKRDRARLELKMQNQISEILQGKPGYDAVQIHTSTPNIFGFYSSKDNNTNQQADAIESLGNDLSKKTFIDGSTSIGGNGVTSLSTFMSQYNTDDNSQRKHGDYDVEAGLDSLSWNTGATTYQKYNDILSAIISNITNYNNRGEVIAHGNLPKFTKEELDDIISGFKNFLVTNPSTEGFDENTWVNDIRSFINKRPKLAQYINSIFDNLIEKQDVTPGTSTIAGGEDGNPTDNSEHNTELTEEEKLVQERAKYYSDEDKSPWDNTYYDDYDDFLTDIIGGRDDNNGDLNKTGFWRDTFIRELFTPKDSSIDDVLGDKGDLRLGGKTWQENVMLFLMKLAYAPKYESPRVGDKMISRELVKYLTQSGVDSRQVVTGIKLKYLSDPEFKALIDTLTNDKAYRTMQVLEKELAEYKRKSTKNPEEFKNGGIINNFQEGGGFAEINRKETRAAKEFSNISKDKQVDAMQRAKFDTAGFWHDQTNVANATAVALDLANLFDPEPISSAVLGVGSDIASAYADWKDPNISTSDWWKARMVQLGLTTGALALPGLESVKIAKKALPLVKNAAKFGLTAYGVGMGLWGSVQEGELIIKNWLDPKHEWTRHDTDMVLHIALWLLGTGKFGLNHITNKRVREAINKEGIKSGEVSTNIAGKDVNLTPKEVETIRGAAEKRNTTATDAEKAAIAKLKEIKTDLNDDQAKAAVKKIFNIQSNVEADADRLGKIKNRFKSSEVTVRPEVIRGVPEEITYKASALPFFGVNRQRTDRLRTQSEIDDASHWYWFGNAATNKLELAAGFGHFTNKATSRRVEGPLLALPTSSQVSKTKSSTETANNSEVKITSSNENPLGSAGLVLSVSQPASEKPLGLSAPEYALSANLRNKYEALQLRAANLRSTKSSNKSLNIKYDTTDGKWKIKENGEWKVITKETKGVINKLVGKDAESGILQIEKLLNRSKLRRPNISLEQKGGKLDRLKELLNKK